MVVVVVVVVVVVARCPSKFSLCWCGLMPMRILWLLLLWVSTHPNVMFTVIGQSRSSLHAYCTGPIPIHTLCLLWRTKTSLFFCVIIDFLCLLFNAHPSSITTIGQYPSTVRVCGLWGKFHHFYPNTMLAVVEQHPSKFYERGLLANSHPISMVFEITTPRQTSKLCNTCYEPIPVRVSDFLWVYIYASCVFIRENPCPGKCICCCGSTSVHITKLSTGTQLYLNPKYVCGTTPPEF